jgi:hypothetical protein
MLHLVTVVRTDVSEKSSITITRVKRISELGPTLVVISNRSTHTNDGSATFLRNVGSYNSHTA